MVVNIKNVMYLIALAVLSKDHLLFVLCYAKEET
jgi:hypothetical protein